MSSFVRTSKYRHIFVDQPAHDQKFDNLRLSTTQGEHQYIKANTKFIAVGVAGGGGPVAILNHDKPGRLGVSPPTLAGHKGQVFDFDFNPFHENILATGSDDTTVKIWGIPEGGLTETITEPLVDLHGHGKKVTLMRFHPTANNILATVSADHSVKLWDVEKGSELFTQDAHPDLIQDIVWDHLGRNYATSCKDKTVRIFDARENTNTMSIPTCHQGSKSCKLTFLGPRENFISLGFTRQSQREIKVWDPRSLQAPLKTEVIDQSAGVIIPYFDPDTNVLYLAGKGDGNIRYYEIIDEQPYLFKLSEYRTTVSGKGVCFVPKRACNVLKCETARALKLTSNAIEPLSFIVPRRSDAFQDDIFPPTFAGVPACSADEWLDGVDKEAPKVSLDPTSSGRVVQSAAAAAEAPKASGIKTRSQLQAELDKAEGYIEALTKALSDAGLAVPPKP